MPMLPSFTNLHSSFLDKKTVSARKNSEFFVSAKSGRKISLSFFEKITKKDFKTKESSKIGISEKIKKTENSSRQKR